MTTIKAEFPPMWEKIKEAFDFKDMTPLFAYDRIVYNPFKGFIDDFMIEHEEVHFAQQDEMGAEAWWDKYIADPKFRFVQELEAYQAQFAAYCEAVPGEKDRNQYLRFLADNLSSPMYGELVDMFKAKELISQ